MDLEQDGQIVFEKIIIEELKTVTQSFYIKYSLSSITMAEREYAHYFTVRTART